MKKIFFLVMILFTSILVKSQSKHYYWYGNEKQYLNINSKKKFILLEDVMEKKQGLDLRAYSNKSNLGCVVPYETELLDDSVKYWTIGQSQQQIEGIRNYDDVIYEAPVYYDSRGEDLGISHLFYVKLLNKTDIQLLEKMAQELGVEILGYNEDMPLWYTLSCGKNSKGNALEMANTLYETGKFQYAEPDRIISNIKACVNDTFFNDQWGLKNTGQYDGTTGIDINVCDAWEITTGDTSVVTAVIDEGIEKDHPDLSSNMYSYSYDSYYGSSPSTQWDYHGTACAGIIGAQTDNDTGIAGINPGGQLMDISNPLMSGPGLIQQLSDGINKAWKNGADILSNSWAVDSSSQSYLMIEAIDSALTFGRDGKGCVVIFVAGNYWYPENEDSVVKYPSRSNPDILTVGAISQCGERCFKHSCDKENKWGSCFGNELDIMAPGALISTTDLLSTDGINNEVNLHTASGGDIVSDDYPWWMAEYTKVFNGTSAACPHVAGVAGLVLSVNPGLTQKEVANILESTAQKVNENTYAYQTTQGRPNGTWNNEMGYGLVDAYCAVYQAGPLPLSGNLSGDYKRFFINVDNATVQNGESATFTGEEININGTFEVETGGIFEIKKGTSFSCPDP